MSFYGVMFFVETLLGQTEILKSFQVLDLLELRLELEVVLYELVSMDAVVAKQVAKTKGIMLHYFKSSLFVSLPNQILSIVSRSKQHYRTKKELIKTNVTTKYNENMGSVEVILTLFLTRRDQMVSSNYKAFY